MLLGKRPKKSISFFKEHTLGKAVSITSNRLGITFLYSQLLYCTGTKILDKINEHLDHLSPHFNDDKMVHFCSFVPSSLLCEDGALLFPFSLSKIV